MSAKVHPIFADILKSIDEPRWAKADRLDNLLREFNPDYNEAEELLNALFSNLKYRVSDGEWDRIEIALNNFKDKLYRISNMHAEQDDPE